MLYRTALTPSMSYRALQVHGWSTPFAPARGEASLAWAAGANLVPLLQKLLGPDEPSPLPLPELAAIRPGPFTFGHLHALVGLLYGRTKGPGATGG